jgi:hypothetical protein
MLNQNNSVWSILFIIKKKLEYYFYIKKVKNNFQKIFLIFNILCCILIKYKHEL